MKILVTGGAGFIGSHLIDSLLQQGHEVVNVDNFDGFYSRSQKEENLKGHFSYSNYHFLEGDVTDHDFLEKAFSLSAFDQVVHLAAKAGVRPSIEDPEKYEAVNVGGTIRLLEHARKNKVPKFILASSSSVYGSNPSVPWRESDRDLQPISPYAASKIAAENYGRVYSVLYDIHFIALRFFTVYGPRQRPDLAIHKFFRSIYEGRPIPFFGDGSSRRDYTFIDDVIKGVMKAIMRERKGQSFEVYNLGNSSPVTLAELVKMIEDIAGKKAILERLPGQAGDVERTFADIEMAEKELGYSPSVSLPDGLARFNEWIIELNNKKIRS